MQALGIYHQTRSAREMHKQCGTCTLHTKISTTSRHTRTLRPNASSSRIWLFLRRHCSAKIGHAPQTGEAIKSNEAFPLSNMSYLISHYLGTISPSYQILLAFQKLDGKILRLNSQSAPLSAQLEDLPRSFEQL